MGTFKFKTNIETKTEIKTQTETEAKTSQLQDELSEWYHPLVDSSIVGSKGARGRGTCPGFGNRW